MKKTKRDIDKEIMFNKIMPSYLNNNDESALADDDEATAENGIDQVIEETNESVVQPPESEESNESTQKPKSKQKDSTKAVSKAKSGVMVNNTKETVLINIKEKMIMNRLDEALTRYNVCKCYCCRQYIVAYALNKSEPKYIVSAIDDVDEIIKNENYSEVNSAIIQAILYMKANPRH